MTVITALKRLRQEDLEFKANLGYIARPHLKKKENIKKFKLTLGTSGSHL
jgi:hypothetical protein